ncbi:hypothetical protein DNU06_02200 [Putridiphycobacter roseus]|uniref:Uncharacterized protein n=1 Tax=Putridiphycobacter roseus TaxID=2219161 RepID=A0A2W1NSN8_9FLAO|nr:hypothetical protein [Putridiphycobacter roseus]PZE18662.1 hypothetical protein DNU06_02200 [Putridiphycobacter roseus]
MKKITSIILGIFLSLTAFSQKVVYTDVDKVNEAKTAGIFHFEFDNTYPLTEINKVADYYTKFFTVISTPISTGGTAVQITLVEDTEMARKVTLRFFISLAVDQIEIMGADLKTTEFVDKFIQK